MPISKKALADLDVTEEQLPVIKANICPDFTDDEVLYFLYKCHEHSVDPLSGMLVPMKRLDKRTNKYRITMTASVDFLRTRANATGELGGIGEPEYGPLKSKQGETTYPEWCKVSVYKTGGQMPFVGLVYWDEFYPGEAAGAMWRQKPRLMLAKCAEGQALRKGFPAPLKNIYVTEELQVEDAPSPPSKVSTVRETSHAPVQEPPVHPDVDDTEPSPPAPPEAPEAQVGVAGDDIKAKLIAELMEYAGEFEEDYEVVLARLSGFEGSRGVVTMNLDKMSGANEKNVRWMSEVRRKLKAEADTRRVGDIPF